MGHNVKRVVDRASLEFTMAGDDVEKLRSLFRSERLSPFIGFLSVALIALSKLTGRSDVSIVIPANGNLLVIPADIAPSRSIREVLQQIRRTVINAHAETPGERPDQLGHFFFDVEVVSPSPAADRVTAGFDFELFASVAPSNVRWCIAYATTLFDHHAVEQVAENVGLISNRLAQRPDAPVGGPGDIPDQPPTREEALAVLYSELLGVGPVGVRENFFLLGGNSLLAIRLVNTVRTRMGVELPLRAVFEAATPAELAGRLDEGTPVRAPLIRRPRET